MTRLERNGNPGGWPTGPLVTDTEYLCRDLCNAGADLLDAVAIPLRIQQLVTWLNRLVSTR